jgi:uncharacterized protein YlxW (UPF0749 family)
MSQAPGQADSSMNLLNAVMQAPLDPGYATAAQHRGNTHRGARALAVLMLTLFGVLTGISWREAHDKNPASSQARKKLESEIANIDREGRNLQAQNASLARKIETERNKLLLLRAQGGLADQVADLGLATGAAAVRGPGVKVTIDDPYAYAEGGANADPRAEGADSDHRVIDQDIQVLVNDLWFAGAEAISINGQRLTATSPIRSVANSIMVDYRAIVPPYIISALGDPDTLETRFNSGPGGQDMQYLKDNYNLGISIESVKTVTLPASAALTTRLARVATVAGDASATSTKGTS